MSEPEELNSPPDQEAEDAPFVPSPVSRRIWAWMAIVYVVMAIVLVTYWIATTTFLSGVTGLMLFPLLGALCAQGINNFRLCRRGERPGSPRLLLTTALLMGLVALTSLVLGLGQLAFALGG